MDNEAKECNPIILTIKNYNYLTLLYDSNYDALQQICKDNILFLQNEC